MTPRTKRLSGNLRRRVDPCQMPRQDAQPEQAEHDGHEAARKVSIGKNGTL